MQDAAVIPSAPPSLPGGTAWPAVLSCLQRERAFRLLFSKLLLQKMRIPTLFVALLLAANLGCGGGNNATHTGTPVSGTPTSLSISDSSAEDVTATSAVITWATSIPASSQVEYGISTVYGSITALNSTAVANHSVALSGLNGSTVYHYRVLSASGSDQASSGDQTFSTAGAASASAPLCSTPPAGKVISATPSNYKSLLGTLQAGDTLALAPGNYPLLHISGLRGTSSECIFITGPASGTPAVIQGVAGNNTVEIASSSFLAIENLTIDSLGIDGAFGISAHGGTLDQTHDILIQGNTMVGQGAT